MTLGAHLYAPLPAVGTAPTIDGDPSAVLAGARKIAGLATDLQSIGRAINGLADATATSQVWFSAGALSFHTSATELAGWYGNAAAAHAQAAQALATYAAALRQAQHVAQAAAAALDAVEQSRQAHNAKLAALQSSPDPGQELLHVADLSAERGQITAAASKGHALGNDAVQIVKAAAQKASAALHDAASMTRARRRAAAAAAQQKDSEDHGLLSTIGHGILDVGGLVPVIGEPADGLNAIWYGAEGDSLNAGLSAAGMIPFVGWGATGGKFVGKGAKAIEGASDAAKLADDGVDVAKLAEDAGSAARHRPDWLVRVQEGTQWHRDVQNPLTAGDHLQVKFVDETTGSTLGGPGWSKELYVHGDSASGYRRVDGYHDAGSGTILSLKHSQFGEDGVQRAKDALNELSNKYAPGTPIASVPSTPGHLVDESLRGDMVLGIPVQTSPLPQSVIDHARDLGIRIAEIDVKVTKTVP